MVVLLITGAFGIGVLVGWDSGVRDAQNLITSQTP